MKTAERAENLRQAKRRFNNVESLTMATREKLMGKEVVDNNRPEDEDMHVGDDNSTRNIYYPAQPQPSALGSIAKAAIVAAGMASGLGGAGYFIADALKKPEPTPSTPVIDTDTNTEYEVDLVP